MPRAPKFHVFRYQLLPITRVAEPELFEVLRPVEETLARKNEIFARALDGIENFDTERSTLTYKPLYAKGDFYIYRFAVSRALDRETKDFKREEVDNWPSFLVVIWNHPDRQIIAVEERKEAFQHEHTVVKIVLNLISTRMAKENLRAHWEPIFEQKIFWDLVSANPGRIQEICFELVTPNMANISHTLSDELKAVAKDTNSTKTSINLEADPASHLNIDPLNKDVKGLVDYASAGGGNIKVRLRGVKKTIKTSKTSKTVEVTEVEAESPDALAAVLKTLLQL